MCAGKSAYDLVVPGALRYSPTPEEVKHTGADLKPSIAASHSLSVRMKAGIGEALSFILPEKPGVAQPDVIDFVSGAPPIQPVPVFLRCLTLPETRSVWRSQTIHAVCGGHRRDTQCVEVTDETRSVRRSQTRHAV